MFRITPAYAGNTTLRCKNQHSGWDHPRIRGEHLYSLVMSSSHQGSPPHTRGTHNISYIKYSRSGITPAYAGNTDYQYMIEHYPEDHPRLRGEHSFYLCDISCDIGSPPPTRGTRTSLSCSVCSFRITPAYAGNT